MNRLLEQFRNFISHYRDSTIFVGFSGGADSTALLLLLDRCMEEFNLKLEAVHFDHGLRPGSDEDARWCEGFCADRFINFRMRKLDVANRIQQGESIETAARRLRLEAWWDIAGCDSIIALGHHRGDRVENSLLRLCRGANVSGLTSLRPSQTVNNMILIRPLLDWSKNDIEKYLRSINILFWREDATNHDPMYKRNLLRQVILPRIYQEMPYAEGGMIRSLEALEFDAAFIEEAAGRQLHRVSGKKYLPAEFIRELHQALLIRVLRGWLSKQTGRDTIPDYNLVFRVIAAAQAERSSGESCIIPFRRDLQLEMYNGRLSIFKPTLPLKFGVIEWDWQQEEEISYGPHLLRAEFLSEETPEMPPNPDRFSAVFPINSLPKFLCVRGWQDGDRMVPAGRKSPVKLKKLFSDLKISARDKKHYPVMLTPDGEILWVAGIRQTAKNADAGTPLIRFSYILNPETNPKF